MWGGPAEGPPPGSAGVLPASGLGLPGRRGAKARSVGYTDVMTHAEVSRERVVTPRRRVRRAALAALAAVCLATVMATLATASPARAAGVDDWVHIWEVVRLAKSQQASPVPPYGPFIYYLGDSIARESTISDASWTSQLRKLAVKAGRAPGAVAYSVAGHNQTFGQDETIVSELPATPVGRPAGIVLIGVGISRFIGPPTPKDPASVGPVPEHPPYFSAWDHHLYDDRPLLPVERKHELVPRWMDRRWKGFQQNQRANFAAIERIIKACRAKGLRPVLIDMPLDLEIVGNGLYQPRSAIHAGCNRLARKYDLTYLHLQPALKLPNTAFWDIHHLVRSGYTRWQTRLSQKLVPLLPRASGAPSRHAAP